MNHNFNSHHGGSRTTPLLLVLVIILAFLVQLIFLPLITE